LSLGGHAATFEVAKDLLASHERGLLEADTDSSEGSDEEAHVLGRPGRISRQARPTVSDTVVDKGVLSESLERHSSPCGQILARIIEHALGKNANLMYLFHRYDKDGSGGLDRKAFVAALRELGVDVTREELTELIRDIGLNFGGSISIAELANRIRQVWFSSAVPCCLKST
jgi:hypothetical protein